MDLTALLLAPVRVPLRVARALDDLTVLADRARREPDPVEEVRERLDALLAELVALNVVAREIVIGGRDLEGSTRAVEARAAEIVSGGADLTAVAAQLETDLRALLAALPRILSAVDTVEELEGAVETVAETIEPLQGTAERVGRVTQRLSRRRGA